MSKRMYKSRMMQVQYDACMSAAVSKSSELFNADGTPRLHGATHRCFFWLGAGVYPAHPMPPKLTMGWASYQAGRDYARMEKKP